MILWSPNGATPAGDSGPTAQAAEGTGGTETSHVPRGKERIPVVAASEPGGAQTRSAYEAAAAADVGLNAMTGGPGRGLARFVPVLAEPYWNSGPEKVRVL